jgi:hypothetical protein
MVVIRSLFSHSHYNVVRAYPIMMQQSIEQAIDEPYETVRHDNAFVTKRYPSHLFALSHVYFVLVVDLRIFSSVPQFSLLSLMTARPIIYPMRLPAHSHSVYQIFNRYMEHTERKGRDNDIHCFVIHGP